MLNEELEKYQQEKQRQEDLEHRDVLLAIQAIIKTKEGQKLFSYLFKSFEVLELPDKTEEGVFLHEHLGFLRAGNSIYKLACEAAYEQTGLLMAKIERERYDDKLHIHRITNGYTSRRDED